jgi:acetolactate synthase-1/2/3 large subunit
MTVHVGQQLVDRLIGYGVQRIFGVPGGQTLPLYHGLARRTDQIEHVLVHDERSGVYAADAYALATGRLGVCDATVGPGASNLVSGLVEAYSSSVPVLAIVSDIPRRWEHRRAYGSASQAFEQRRFLEGCVKWYGRVETPESLPEILHAVIRIATSGRPGPTVLEIPDDVFEDAAGPETFAPTPELTRYPGTRAGADAASVRQAVEVLARSRRPMVVAGGGALHAGAEAEVTALIEALGCPVATTITGKGAVPETHPLNVGIVGRFGIPMANATLEDADCVIYVGCKTGQTTTLNWTLPYLDTPIVHIDSDPQELGRNYHDTVGIAADAKLGTAALVAALAGRPAASDWDRDRIAGLRAAWWDGPIEFKAEPEAGILKPQDLVRIMRRLMSDDDVLVSDASLASGWVATRWQTRVSGRRTFAPRGLAGLGWGLPAAVGVAEAQGLRGDAGTVGSPGAVGNPGKGGRPARVFCIAGDGGWGYSMAEIETAARRGLPIIAIVLNNNSLGWIKHSAATRFPDGIVSENFIEVSYADAAAALGAQATRVDTLDGFEAALATAIADDRRIPWVIEARSCDIETPVLPSRPPRAPSDDAPTGGY